MFPLAFIQNLGVMEWVIILAIALLIFGTRLPKVARSLGSSVNEFKKGVKEGAEEGEEAETQTPAPTKK